MRRIAIVVSSSLLLLAMLTGTAAGRSLIVRTDPNDTPGSRDIRRVWTDVSGGAVFVKIGNWTRLRHARFSVVMDTRGSREFDRIIEISAAGAGTCVVEELEGGFLADFIGRRDTRRPTARTISCQLPAGWFAITRTIRFVVLTGVAGETHADRAPNEGRFVFM